MIPKIIHYCWLSKDSYPANIQKCIDSWKRVLPDYEIWLWNFERFDINSSIWVKEAFEHKKYAFAADYIRLYALYNYGGIYLDSDVEVLKSFDDLLDLPYFIGKENTPSGIEAATIGCEKGFSLMAKMLQRYEGRHFVKDDGTLDCRPLPFIFRACIETRFKFNAINEKSQFLNDDSIINVFPIDWFSPKTWNTQVLEVTDNTYSIHHFAASWAKEKVSNDRRNKASNILFIIKVKLFNFIQHCVFTQKTFAKLFFKTLNRDRWLLNGSAIVWKEYYHELASLNKSICCYDIEFFDQRDTHHKSGDFYPVARLKDTNIELHFIDCISIEQAKKSWHKCDTN